MCGLSGIYTTSISAREKAVFEALLTVSNLRGSEGSGVITANRNETYNYYKILGSGVELMKSKGYSDLFSTIHAQSASTIIGHTRAPTKGGRDRESVHPHDVKQIIGVHNGTLYRVNDTMCPFNKSDSKAAFGDIAERGIEAFVQGAEGAYALVWLNKEERTLNFLRNSQRPLWFAKVGHGIKNNKDQKPVTLFWSSEKLFLHFALLRANFKEDEFVLEELPINTLVTYHMIARGAIEPLEVRTVAKVYPTYHATRRGVGETMMEHTGRYLPRYVSSGTHAPVVPITSTKTENRSGGSETPGLGERQLATRWVLYKGVDPNNLIVKMHKIRDYMGSADIYLYCTWSNGSITETLGFPDAKYLPGIIQAMHMEGVIPRKDVVPFDFNSVVQRQKIAKELARDVKQDNAPFPSSSEPVENLFEKAYGQANVPPNRRLSKSEKRAQRAMLKTLARQEKRNQREKTMAALHEHMEKQSTLEAPDPEDKNDSCQLATNIAAEIAESAPVEVDEVVNEVDEVTEKEVDPTEDSDPFLAHQTYGNYILSDDEYRHVIKKTGCAWCTETIKDEKTQGIHWFARDEFLCDRCEGDEFARNYVGALRESDYDEHGNPKKWFRDSSLH